MAAKRTAVEENLRGKKRFKSGGKDEILSSIHLDQNEDIDFPRGGSTVLSPLEVRRIKQEAEKDVLFGTQMTGKGDKKKKKRIKSKGTTSEKFGNVEEGSTAPASRLKHVENLSFKKLCIGMKLLGAVKDISELEIIVSLPNGLSGFVHIMDINEKVLAAATAYEDKEDEDNFPSLEDIFTVNSLVVCVIKELSGSKHGHRKIKLSLRPEDINSGITDISQGMVLTGCVSSIEDHGYVVSFGISGKNGFIPNKLAPQDHKLKLGQQVPALVESVGAEGRAITLTTEEEKIRAAMVTVNMKVRLSSLMPGMLVKTAVNQCMPNGLLVSFLDMFEGTINIIHLPDCGANGQNIEKKYSKKSKHSGRILFVNPKNKSVGLSLLGPILQYKSHSFGSYSVGDIIDAATVIRVEQGLGLLMSISDGVNGFVHISRVSDANTDKLGKKHKAGTSHRCRVLGFNMIDGLVSLTMEKSVIERPFLRYHDIKLGAVVECTIITLEKFGMLVSVAEQIKGLVTNLHLADITLKHPEKKFNEGKKLKCRVLSVSPAERRLHLTNKKTLVSSTLPLITEYSDAVHGLTTHGFIVSVKDYGCLVAFYNNVKGLVPRAELGIQETEDPCSVFYIGQVVTCHVLSCKPEDGKLKLSFKASSSKRLSTQHLNLNIGSLVDVDVVSSSDEGLDVLIQPNECPALLPTTHLSDHPSHWQAMLPLYKPSGKPIRISDVVYYGVSRKTHIVSLKPSIRSAAITGKMLSNFTDLKVGMLLSGFVKQLMGYGVFIEFTPGIFGLAPNSFISNQFVSDPSSHFKVGQSVLAKVCEIDTERRRFLVSLKQSDTNAKSGLDWGSAVAGELLLDILRERHDILNYLALKSENMQTLMSLSVGSHVDAKVKKVKKHGITLSLANGVQGFVSHQLAQGVSCQEGEVVYGCVLDYDIDTTMVNVTLTPQIVEAVKQDGDRKSKQKKVKAGQVVDCIIQLIKEDYLVVCLPSAGFRMAFAPTKMHLNDIRDASKRFAVGEKYRTIVHGCTEYCVVIPEEKHFNKEDLTPGVIVSAEVKSVKALQMNVQLAGSRFHGRVHISHASDVIDEGQSPFKTFRSGDKIEVKILGFRDTKSHNFLPVTHKNFAKAVAELSIKPSDLGVDCKKNESTAVVGASSISETPKLDGYQIGEEVHAFVKSATDHCVWMVVSTSVNGRVSLLHASSDIKVLCKLSSSFKPGTGYTCTVLGVDREHDVLDLSITVKPGTELCSGQVVPGRITRVSPTSGLFIQLPLHKCGMASLTNINDHYNDSPLENIKVRQIVKCYIILKKEDDHYDLSLRPSRTKVVSTAETQKVEDSSDPKRDREIQSLADLNVGDLIRGYVKCCKDVGVFVSLAHHIVARVQIKNLSHFFVKNWKPLFPPGKLVTGKVLSIDPSNGYVELSLKGKDTGGPDPAPNPKASEKKAKKRKKDAATGLKTIDADDKDEEEAVIKRLKADDSDCESGEPVEGSESESSSKQPDSSEEEEEEEASSNILPSSKMARLQVSAGFSWKVDQADKLDLGTHVPSSGEESSEEEMNEQMSRKRTKRQKRASKKAEEDFLYRTEQALLDTEHIPQSAEDFDRLVLSSPNSSVTWLQYMAFHLHTTEIDKARVIAERALRTISFREEREKLNIWVALMNLENLYGTQESLIKVFERALQHNEPKKVFFHLITIYTKSDKNELAEQLFNSMAKRFSQSKKVWIEFGRFLMRINKAEAARKLQQRGLKCLPSRKHVDTIVQFALMEFKYGDHQRGQTVLEGVLSNYPKRTDLWSVYIDMMSKQGNIDAVRQIFERVIHMNLSSRKMKFLFKRYMEYEREHGDDLSVEKVKTKAMEYVESKVDLT